MPSRRILRTLVPLAIAGLFAIRRARASEAAQPNLAAEAQLAAAQRADLASTASLNAALSGASLAFVAASLFYRTQLRDNLASGIVLVPIPVWIAGTFAALASAALRSRMVVLRQVETAIIEHSQNPEIHAAGKDWTKADDIMEWDRASHLARALLLLTSLPTVLLVCAYTCFFALDSIAPRPISLAATSFYLAWASLLVAFLMKNWRTPQS